MHITWCTPILLQSKHTFMTFNHLFYFSLCAANPQPWVSLIIRPKGQFQIPKLGKNSRIGRQG